MYGKQSNPVLPRLILVKDNKYIFEASELFSSQAAVSLFYVDEIEQYMGFGLIETVHSVTGRLQVTVIKFEESFNELYAKRNKRNVVLKPTIPLDTIQNHYSGRDTQNV